jgi:hypothetical protein
MLFDPKWNAPSLNGFLVWLETMPAEQKYPHMDCENCACGQYAAWLGEPDWPGKARAGHAVWNKLNRIACARGWTFGALRKRVQRACKSERD